MHSRYRNIVAALLVAVIGAVILNACGGVKTNVLDLENGIPEGREVITLACVEEPAYLEMIDAFNSSQDQYYIQKIDYAPENPEEDANTTFSREKLMDELKSGNGPDIIDVSSFYMFVDDANLNQYLEDLYPYLDQDGELDRSDFIPSFMKAYEVDGALYSTVNALLINIVAVSDSVADQGIFNVDMIADAALQVNGGENLSYVRMNSDVLFCKLVYAFAYDFLNAEEGTVNFACDGYRNLLKVCKEAGNEAYTGEDVNKAGVLYPDDFRTLYHPQLFRACFGSDFVFASGLEGNVASYWQDPFEKLAMNRSSQNKEGAWQFLRVFMTEEYQKQCTTLPTNLHALEDMIEDARQGLVHKEMDSAIFRGKIIHDYEPPTSFDSSNIAYGLVTEGDIQSVLDLINSTTRIISVKEGDCIEAAREIAQQYFEDKIDLDTAASMTQERIAKMLEE